jgi:hypothetical protein
MINLKASKKTPTITVGVNPVITNVVNAPSTQPPPDGELIARDVTLTEPVDEVADLKRQIEVLKLIIEIQQSNPLVVNKYIIADDEVLERMISLLCNAEAVQIDAEDLGSGCMTKHVYRKVESIYVTVGGKTLNLKYDFPAVMKTLKDLHISTKFVF